MNRFVMAVSIKDIKEGISDALHSGGDFDYLHIFQITRDVRKILEFLYGFIIVVILVTIPIIVSVELIYICFPYLRDHMENLVVKVEGSGFVGKAIGFTLRDARKAIERSETTQVGTNPLWIYLRLKCTSLMMVMFIVALVLTGSQGFIGFVKSLIDNVITQIFY